MRAVGQSGHHPSAFGFAGDVEHFPIAGPPGHGRRHYAAPTVAAERINVPAIPNYYWRYRLHLPLEALGRAQNFGRLVENLVRQSGR